MSFVLGIMGSPRKNGSSEKLLNLFISKLKEKPLKTMIVNVCDLKIMGCKGCRFCEKNGTCVISDDMEEICYLLKEADLIVISTPVFFYHVPSQLKALIDRSQMLWARRYRLRLSDPKESWRKGFVIATGATKGENLFSGIYLTAKYFFDAVGCKFEGVFGIRKVENPEDIELFPEHVSSLQTKAEEFAKSLSTRKKIAFLCKENSARSQIAEAFLQKEAGGLVTVFSGGDSAASRIDPLVIEVMAEIGVDMKFKRPKGLEYLLPFAPFDLLVTMGCGIECPFLPAYAQKNWQIEDPKGKPIEKFREVRDIIQRKVKELISTKFS